MKPFSSRTYVMVGTAYILFIPFYFLAIYILRIDIQGLTESVPIILFGIYFIYNGLYIISLFNKNKKFTYQAFRPILFQIMLMVVMFLFLYSIVVFVELM
ncbi:MAG: hypothetical protein KKE16_02920 [Firmicutes bacterium]|nr:hypothetical protein [Bacillota bacterium]